MSKDFFQGALQFIVNQQANNSNNASLGNVNDSMYITCQSDFTTPLLRPARINSRRIFENENSRTRSREAILNCKVFMLIMLFLSGVLIGVYLLTHDCKFYKKFFILYFFLNLNLNLLCR
jgi:hypothetical protein